jgi:hypothetical protein
VAESKRVRVNVLESKGEGIRDRSRNHGAALSDELSSLGDLPARAVTLPIQVVVMVVVVVVVVVMIVKGGGGRLKM